MRISDWSSDVCSSDLLCKLTPFTARWFRFNPTRRAKIRLGPMGLLRRASIGAEGSTKQTRWGRHLSSKTTGLRDLRQRVSALFQDHEILVRTHGHVRFLRVSAVWQHGVALTACPVRLAWAGPQPPLPFH